MSPGSTPRIVFRADASLEIGTGHVMRCLTLADVLRERGASCEFVCRALPGDRIEEIRRRGFDVRAGDEPRAAGSPRADWLVVDHYGLDRDWEQSLRSAADRIMVIDDLADRPHDCDLLLDQNLGSTPGDYDRLVPLGCELLCGPKFALLRPEFAALRADGLEQRRARRAGSPVTRVLVSMGGVDRDNATGRVLEVLGAATLRGEVEVTVVMGGAAPWIGQVRAQAEVLPFPVEVAVDVGDMAVRMAASDFSIGAAGSTSWERCCMGLPSALVVLADNQVKLCRELVGAGAAFALGGPEEVAATLPPVLGTIWTEPQRLADMSAAAAAICDGLGTRRVADRLLATHGGRDAPGSGTWRRD
ncbi:UDP-2,4-diacetamido-2,4,6-trideoxy-beta-L-altropyranose hydrolase [Wenzhouxiangella sp. XN24]|uniref:UDP-2,4-diacetamido-2,4, 6-trideoxy-beta-L-altropyranose hydrolase n=1 Tax=Wenzhouxiangella sp. XN24 TaxID=2713569 RepID=UPI0013EE1AB8|nr:UDP-2,4-diacetamido-2,4,6-trideoxy-beta-L-altropyranose hydrolase [Wenzhouxiangella sp. XN24]NGX17174.1 UDP-2,4-diacetamido-2,4,6-trideoxy-beta-L-altropyranose hydrolase [Wenzhouxiangella sp. XN24]